jgi:hypothetical protein
MYHLIHMIAREKFKLEKVNLWLELDGYCYRRGKEAQNPLISFAVVRSISGMPRRCAWLPQDACWFTW